MSFPEINRINEKTLPRMVCCEYHRDNDFCSLPSKKISEERQSRAVWAQALLDELECYNPETKTKLSVLDVNVARVKAELRKQIEVDKLGE